MASQRAIALQRSTAANKAWATRRANAVQPNLVAALRPSTTRTTSPAPVAADSLTKGLRKRSITAKTVVEKIEMATSMEYFTSPTRSVIVLHNQ